STSQYWNRPAEGFLYCHGCGWACRFVSQRSTADRVADALILYALRIFLYPRAQPHGRILQTLEYLDHPVPGLVTDHLCVDYRDIMGPVWGDLRPSGVWLARRLRPIYLLDGSVVHHYASWSNDSTPLPRTLWQPYPVAGCHRRDRCFIYPHRNGQQRHSGYPPSGRYSIAFGLGLARHVLFISGRITAQTSDAVGQEIFFSRVSTHRSGPSGRSALCHRYIQH